MTQTFHQHVETVSPSNHLAMRTWGPLCHLLARPFSRGSSARTSAHSSTDSRQADTRHSPGKILNARPFRRGKAPPLLCLNARRRIAVSR